LGGGRLILSEIIWRTTMELDLRDYIKIIRKRLWIILSIVLVTTLTVGIISFLFLKPVYQASTKLIVNKSNDQVSLNQVDINTINTNLRLIDTYKEIIKTTAIMDNVAIAHPEFQLTAEQLVSKVQVSSVNNTQVMTLIVEDYSYEKAANIVNAVSEIFEKEIPKLMSVDNVSILNKAKMKENPTPVKPNKKLNVAIGFIVSLMVALGLVFLLEYLDDTIKTEADIQQYLEIPTLAMIAKVRPEDIQEREEKHSSKVRSEPINVKLNN
jgi:capsular polysaccharide biosynthesis protein